MWRVKARQTCRFSARAEGNDMSDPKSILDVGHYMKPGRFILYLVSS